MNEMMPTTSIGGGFITATPLQGYWVAYYSDRSSAVVFASEVEALRHAVANHMDKVEHRPWGAEVFTGQEQS